MDSHAKEDREQAIAKLESVKVQKEQEIALLVTDQIEQTTLDQARKLATVGTGESQKAHGFTLIVGDAKQLLDPKVGGVQGRMHDYRGMDLTVDDFKPLQAAIVQDGGVVIDRSTRAMVCANYMVYNIGEGHDGGGARHRSASAIAQQCGGCFVIKASEDACGIAASKIDDAELDVFRGCKMPTKVRVHPNK